jgi:hypothetical protein
MAYDEISIDSLVHPCKVFEWITKTSGKMSTSISFVLKVYGHMEKCKLT